VLEVLVGVIATLLVVSGLAVMAGPALPRLVRSVRAQAAQSRPALRPTERSSGADLNPTTARALNSAEALIRLFHEQGAHRQAGALRLAQRRLQIDEARGLYAMQQFLRQIGSLVLQEASAQARFADLVGDLQHAVADRFEQLELLPRS